MSSPKKASSPEPWDENPATDAADSITSQTHPGIYAKMLRAAGAVGMVEKSGTNNFHNYKYATEAAVVEAARVALLGEGVLFTMSVVSQDVRERTTSSGKSYVTTLVCNAAFTDADDGSFVTFTVLGSGDDPADKGVAKAMTMAKKYALIHGLLIATGDDPEADTETDRRHNAVGPHAATTKPAQTATDEPAKALFGSLSAAAKAGVISPDVVDYKSDAGKAARASLLSRLASRKVGGIKALSPDEMVACSDILKRMVQNKDKPLGAWEEVVAPPHTDDDNLGF